MGIRGLNLSKSFGHPPTTVLHGVNVDIRDGEFVVLTGKSGSGKSTLLYLLGALDTPTAGHVEFDGERLDQMDSFHLHQLRNRRIGFVFQSHHLMPEFTMLENILMPTRKAGLIKERSFRALQLIKEFGLEGKESRLPRQLSGGEQQRVAIARALIMDPKYIFADEPTGSLDSVNGEIVMNLFKKANETLGTTIILVTHDAEFASRASRQIKLVDGRIA